MSIHFILIPVGRAMKKWVFFCSVDPWLML